jgi:FkbM family methyltransferase
VDRFRLRLGRGEHRQLNLPAKIAYILRCLVSSRDYRRSVLTWVSSRLRDAGGPELIVRTNSGSAFRLAEWRNLSEYRFWKRRLIARRERLVIERALLRRDSVCIDVGANIGLYSLYFAACGEMQVFAFEPVTENFKRLVRNLRRNPALAARVVANRIAVSDSNDPLRISFNPASPGWSRVERSGQRPKTIKLDDFCLHHGIEDVALLKVDVEGFETQVLMGAFHLLSGRHIATVLFESFENALRAYGTNRREQWEFLKSAGYVVQSLSGVALSRSDFSVSDDSDFIAVPERR